MKIRNLAILAILFCVPVSLLAYNATADSGTDNSIVVNNDMNANAAVDINSQDNVANNDLNLEEGSADQWGWWGGYGYGWPYYGYGYGFYRPWRYFRSLWW